MAAHQAPPSLGFSRQEHWSGLPFPSPVSSLGLLKRINLDSQNGCADKIRVGTVLSFASGFLMASNLEKPPGRKQCPPSRCAQQVATVLWIDLKPTWGGHSWKQKWLRGKEAFDIRGFKKKNHKAQFVFFKTITLAATWRIDLSTARGKWNRWCCGQTQTSQHNLLMRQSQVYCFLWGSRMGFGPCLGKEKARSNFMENLDCDLR